MSWVKVKETLNYAHRENKTHISHFTGPITLHFEYIIGNE